MPITIDCYNCKKMSFAGYRHHCIVDGEIIMATGVCKLYDSKDDKKDLESICENITEDNNFDRLAYTFRQIGSYIDGICTEYKRI